MSATTRPRRSALYVPGANARALDKARGLEADVLLIDLEDSVAPDAKQAALDDIRGVFQPFPMIPALKVASANYSGDASWETVRPPLMALNAAQKATLLDGLKQRNFDMPGLAEAALS